MLDLADRYGARFFLASTSEVYGDPLVHPQSEDYWGNVNPIGLRSVYDEAKRFAEALTMAYHRTYGLDVRIVRIFNTYGPRMQPDDGRVVTGMKKADVLVTSGKDIQRLLTLAKVTSERNLDTIRRQQAGADPIDAATAGVTNDLAKDNVATDLTAQAKGQAGGIVIAQG